jgi:hypothetical protein
METLKQYIDHKVIGRMVANADLAALNGISGVNDVHPTISAFARAHGLSGRQHLHVLMTRGAIIEKRPNGDGVVKTTNGKAVFVIRDYDYNNANG